MDLSKFTNTHYGNEYFEYCCNFNELSCDAVHLQFLQSKCKPYSLEAYELQKQIDVINTKLEKLRDDFNTFIESRYDIMYNAHMSL